jgi:GNAT superfamily N-acetyltransferase
MRARPLEPSDTVPLEALLSRYPHHDYRAYPRMPVDAGRRLLLGDFAMKSECLAAGGVWLGEAMVAAGLLERLPWDSKHFGLAMGRVGPLVVDPEYASANAIGALLEWLLDRAKEADLAHLAAKVDGAELRTLQALEATGFRLMDCLVTYFYDFHRDPPPSVKQLGTIRDYQPSDLDEIVAIAERMLSEYGGRFAFDPWLPRDRVRRFYVEWARNASAGHMANRLLVGARHGRIVGFLGYRMLPRPLESLGVRVAGQGIGAVLPEGTGLYPALLARAILVERVGTYDFAEFDTPIQNSLPQRVFQRMGFHLARCKYTLHRGRT